MSQYVVESASSWGGPYCYVEAESKDQALELAGLPVHEARVKYGPFAARKLRPEFGEVVEGEFADGTWHSQ